MRRLTLGLGETAEPPLVESTRHPCAVGPRPHCAGRHEAFGLGLKSVKRRNGIGRRWLAWRESFADWRQVGLPQGIPKRLDVLPEHVHVVGVVGGSDPRGDANGYGLQTLLGGVGVTGVAYVRGPLRAESGLLN